MDKLHTVLDNLQKQHNYTSRSEDNSVPHVPPVQTMGDKVEATHALKLIHHYVDILSMISADDVIENVVESGPHRATGNIYEEIN